jgi:hypothetical protein
MTSRGITRREALAAGLVSAAALWSWRTANADAAGSSLANAASTSTSRFTARLGTPQSQPGLLMLGMTTATAASVTQSGAFTQSVQKQSKASSLTSVKTTPKQGVPASRRPSRQVRTRRRERSRAAHHHLRTGKRARRHSVRRRHRIAQSSRRAA